MIRTYVKYTIGKEYNSEIIYINKFIVIYKDIFTIHDQNNN